MNEWVGWWFAPDDRRLANGDGREIQVGVPLAVGGKIVLCRNGLHASRQALDALQYAPGEVACRVRLSSVIVEEDDKAAAAERTVIAMAAAGSLLHEFACWCAERCLHQDRAQQREPDPRLWAAIAAKRQWLAHEITDQQLTAAMAASQAATWDAARLSGRDAAWDAARVVARVASQVTAREPGRDAAWYAASSAAWAAGGDAARNAAWADQNEELEIRLHALLGTSSRERGEKR